MKIDKNETITGYPILKIRDFLRRSDDFSNYTVCQYFKIQEGEAEALIEDLITLEYIKLSTEALPPALMHTKFYEQTAKGRSLANARAVTPLTRSKADELLRQFLERVHVVNESLDFLYKVTKVLVFGSYLRDGVEVLNDLDIAVELMPKYADSEQAKREDMFITEAQFQGRSFSNFIDRLYYPQTAVKLLLKNKSRYISLHSVDDGVLKETTTRQVFPTKG